MEARAVVPRRARGRGKVKETDQQGNRQVLGDIGNLEGNQISRPITRSFHAKLLANGETTANLVPALDVKQNEQAAAQRKKNVIVPVLDKKEIVTKKHGEEDLTHKPSPTPADVVSPDVGQEVDFICESQSRERSCRKEIKTLTSIITARSKAACGLFTKPEDQLVDIDADDVNDELAAVEYLDEIYKFYKLTEDEIRVSDYMTSQPEINANMRSIVVDWLVDVHGRFKLMPETLYLTVNIIDRYLSVTVIPRKELQLLGISSMLIACKYEEIWSPQVNDFASISSDAAYTNDQILTMEKAILEKLQWYLTVPTPFVFLVRFIKASVQPDQELQNLVFFLAELGLVHYETIILYCPSMIAAAAVYAGRCTLNRCPFWSGTLKHHTSYCTEQIIDCAKLLVSLHSDSSAADSKLQAVYRKFSSPERGAVALLTPPKDLTVTNP